MRSEKLSHHRSCGPTSHLLDGLDVRCNNLIALLNQLQVIKTVALSCSLTHNNAVLSFLVLKHQYVGAVVFHFILRESDKLLGSVAVQVAACNFLKDFLPVLDFEDWLRAKKHVAPEHTHELIGMVDCIPVWVFLLPYYSSVLCGRVRVKLYNEVLEKVGIRSGRQLHVDLAVLIVKY